MLNLLIINELHIIGFLGDLRGLKDTIREKLTIPNNLSGSPLKIIPIGVFLNH